MAEYSIVQDFNKYNTNLHNTIKMNQVSLNKESIFLIRETITDFGESISTKNIQTLEKINGKSFQSDIIDKISSQGTGIGTLNSQLRAVQENIGTAQASIGTVQTAITNLQTATTTNATSANTNANSVNTIVSFINTMRKILNELPGIDIDKLET